MKRLMMLLVLLLTLGLDAQSKKPYEKIMVQILFGEEVVVNGMTLEYQDALYLPVDDPSMTVKDWLKAKRTEIDKVKLARVDNWLNLLKNPPEPIKPTKEILQAELVEVEKQKVSLEMRKAELVVLIAAKVAKPVMIEE